MKIKKGDNVIIISGKDKGKTGKVTRAFPKEGSVVVAGANIKKRHRKARKSGEKGQIIEKSLPIPVSNVMFVDPKTSKPSRIGKKKVGDKWLRISKKSQTVLDK
ncbi:MAG: 50S ribosomal protein L24 [Patescibacteria group bacterium]|nr:50S ribosomal protein L24 [bacterium]MDZ4240793.1 50S ribosomal protein L24 [Patescibacteria group bacterium]